MLVKGVESVEYRGEINYNSRIQKADLMMPDLCRKLYSHWFLFLSFRRVVNVIYSFLGNSPASEI